MSLPLVLAPGLACTAALFAPQLARFSPQMPCRVMRHRDHDSLAAIVGEFLETAPPRFALAGLSMGGYLALEVMRQAPERVERLALLDTRASLDTPEDRDRRHATMIMARAGKLHALHALFWQRLVLPERRSDALLEGQILAMMHDTGLEAFVRQQQAILDRPDYRPILASVRVPTLILVGDSDAITPPHMAQELADILPSAKLTVVPRCGHMSTMECPQAVNHALELWLQDRS